MAPFHAVESMASNRGRNGGIAALFHGVESMTSISATFVHFAALFHGVDSMTSNGANPRLPVEAFHAVESMTSNGATFMRFAALFHGVESMPSNGANPAFPWKHSMAWSPWRRMLAMASWLDPPASRRGRYSGLCDSRICLSSACMETTRLKYRSDSSGESEGLFSWPCNATMASS